MTDSSTLIEKLLSVIAGRSIPLDKASSERLLRLLRPLLAFIDEEVRASKRNSTWPPIVHASRNFSSKERRLPQYLRALREDPENARFADSYRAWLEHSGDLAEAARDIETLSDEVIAPPVADGRRRISPNIYSTLWALHYGEGVGDRSMLGYLAQIETILLDSSKKPERHDGAKHRDAVRKARLAGEAKVNRELQARVVKAERDHERAATRVSSLELKATTLEKSLDEAERDHLEERLRANRAEGRLNSANRDIDRLEQRRTTLRERLSEEQARAAATDRRVVDFSEELLKLERDFTSTRAELERVPLGAEGLNRLLVELIDEEKLKRDTSEGRTRETAATKYTVLRNAHDEFASAYPEIATDRSTPPVPQQSKVSFRVAALGGGEIGASAYLLQIAGKSILVDCGLRVGEVDIEHLGPNLPDPATIDEVVVTHAHTDHSGWLPALIAGGYQGRIYCASPTHELMAIMLEDSRRQLERLMADDQQRASYSSSEPSPEPYSNRDLEVTLRRIRPVSFDEYVPLDVDLGFTLFPAGHILGAASALIVGGGRKVLFTGDFSTFPQETVSPARWPDEIAPVDFVATESTYGWGSHGDRRAEVDEFVAALAETIAAGGTAIIPSFALGRAQEVISILAEAMRSKSLPPVAVWIDGMIEKINAIYLEHTPFALPKNFNQVRSEGYLRDDVIDAARRTPCIIVSTSGMLTGGPVVYYASQLLSDPKNRIFFCGYQDEDAPGKKLLNLAETSKAKRSITVPGLDGNVVRITAASPAKKFNLSAHSDKDQILSAVAGTKPAHVMIVHGEERSRRSLLKSFQDAGIEASLELEYEVSPI